MTLTQVKEEVGIKQFNLRISTDEDKNPTDWLRHWDNDNRVAVSIHKELVAELQANSNINSLGLQKNERTGEQGEYTSYRIVKYSPADAVL